MATALDNRAHLHVMIPDEEKICLDHLAAEQRRPKHEIIRDAIREYLAARKESIRRTGRYPKK